MEITYAMNQMQADQLFAAEAVFMYSCDAVPEYRVIELFGDDMARWLDSCCRYEGYMKGGRDYNVSGDCSETIRFFYKAGFYKIVSKANHARILQSHRNSEAGKLADAVMEDRVKDLMRQDAEAERKRQERRAKRAAAKVEAGTNKASADYKEAQA